MSTSAQPDDSYLSQLRLFLEELCCDLLRYEHLIRDGLPEDGVRIHREVSLGLPGVFADIRVALPDQPPYFVEIKHGYPDDRLVRSLRRKYGPDTPGGADATRLILVIDSEP